MMDPTEFTEQDWKEYRRATSLLERMICSMVQDAEYELACMRTLSDDYVRELVKITEAYDLSIQVGVTSIVSDAGKEILKGGLPFATVAATCEIFNKEGKHIGIDALPVYIQEYHQQMSEGYRAGISERITNLSLIKDAYTESVEELISMTLAEQIDEVEATHIAVIYYQDHTKKKLNRLRLNILSGVIEENAPTRYSYEPTEYEKGMMAEECEIDGANIYVVSNPCRKLKTETVVQHVLTELIADYDAEHPDAPEKRASIQRMICPQIGVVALRGRDLPEIERLSQPNDESALITGTAMDRLTETERILLTLGYKKMKTNGRAKA
ncbi:hypothetical protein KY363_05925 [Candidatus Woesearchaeota archaeon]|nr:hypothetical protein [Candidatus Woesearchaeota archaeon]